MPVYRRWRVPGACLFLTLVTHQRRPLFAETENIGRLREALRLVKAEMPFVIEAGVVLPDHLHFLWRLPEGDTQYSARVGRLKILFTRAVRGNKGWEMVGQAHPTEDTSRERHREGDVWQRRFWEHTIRDESDFERHLNYIHYNPVKHGLVRCPHLWPHSSFRQWVARKAYEVGWSCACDGREMSMEFEDIERACGE